VNEPNEDFIVPQIRAHGMARVGTRVHIDYPTTAVVEDRNAPKVMFCRTVVVRGELESGDLPMCEDCVKRYLDYCHAVANMHYEQARNIVEAMTEDAQKREEGQ